MTIHVALWARKHNIQKRDTALNKEKSWLATPEFNQTYHYSVTFACSLLTSICFSFFLNSNSFKCQLPVRSQLLLWHVTYFHASGQSGSFPLHCTQCPVGHQQVRLYHDSRASISSNQCASPSTSPIRLLLGLPFQAWMDGTKTTAGLWSLFNPSLQCFNYVCTSSCFF